MLTAIICWVAIIGGPRVQRVELLYTASELQTLRSDLHNPRDLRQAACANLSTAIEDARDDS